MVIWLVGMSAAGKSTIGRALHAELQAHNPATVLVDGDEIRQVFAAEGPSDYTLEGRRRNNQRIRAVCAWLDRQGIDVVCCVLSVFEDALRWNRRTYSDYFEVYVRAPMPVLAARQPADLYGRAQRGEICDVVGVDLPFPEPTAPDLVIDNGEPAVPVEEAVARIRTAIAARS